MSERLRIVNLRWPKPPAILADLGVTGLSRDTFKVAPGDPSQSLSASTTRWGGSRVVAERRQNATLSVTLLVIGTSKDQALQQIQNVLETALSANQPDLAIEWRPDGATYSSYWRLRGPASYALSYSWAQFTSANMFPVDVSFPVAPTGEGAPYDIFDDFSIDTITLGDWLQDAGTNHLAVSKGSLVPPIIGGPVPTMRYRHARGYSYGDVEVSAKITVTSAGTVSNGNWRICLGMDPTGVETYLALELTSTGSNLIKVVAGTRSVLSTAGSVSATTGGTYYMLLRRAGNVLYWRIATSKNWTEWTVEPNTYQLTAADLRMAAPGNVGLVIAAALNDEFYDDFSARPYTYRGIQSPEQVQLVGTIVGEAPAFADIEVTPVVGSSTNPAMFGLVAWGERPQPQNLVTGGNFTTVRSNGSATYGWSVGAVSGVIGAATSYARGGTTTPMYGGSSLEIHCPATSDTGANFLVTRRFKRGRVYAAFARLAAESGSTLARVKLGVSGDLATGSSVALGSSQNLYSTVWRPTADYDSAFFAAGIAAATITIIDATGVGVVEAPPVTLAAAMTNSQTTLTVYFDPSDIPGLNPDGSLSAPLLAMIDQEMVSVSAIAGTTWTVDRGVESTSAVIHSQDAYVILMPPARPQLEGKGAHPVFGIIEGEYFAADRTATTPTTGDSNYRSGGYVALTSSGSLEWYVDPSSVPPDDFAQGDVLVEVWARLALDPAATGMQLVPSCNSSEQYDPTVALASIAGQRRYTFEHGTDGLSQANGKLRVPSGTNGTLYPQWFKLGTLPMVSDRSKPQRWRIRLDWTQTGGAGIRFDYLATCPPRNRVGTPTGKSSADTTYPSFVPNVVGANAVTKILRADGSALLRMPRLGTYAQPEPFPDSGLGHIDLPNTDCDLMVKLSPLVPNDPGANGQEMPSGEPYWTNSYHVAVTPRVAALRGA